MWLAYITLVYSEGIPKMMYLVKRGASEFYDVHLMIVLICNSLIFFIKEYLHSHGYFLPKLYVWSFLGVNVEFTSRLEPRGKSLRNIVYDIFFIFWYFGFLDFFLDFFVVFFLSYCIGCKRFLRTSDLHLGWNTQSADIK